ncbi:hypothetical protein HPB48_003592 [Haemaphysalis longicornis]|uniref:SUZ domain-containing protein n=1 Tax=Haemaphysalis longicornis TaxID=44386 RepID=A0A9J6FDD2_HAELO|nr:hypothetical protein HPB48_003592 [Haemaphysalis longicornis]
MDTRFSWADIVRRGDREKTSEQLKIAEDPKTSTASREEGGGGEVLEMPCVIPEDDGARVQRAAPVKILQRPSQASSAGGSVNGSEKPPYERQPLKSLQQREAEYAEARLRILGSAYSKDNSKDRKASGAGARNPAVTEPRHPFRPARYPASQLLPSAAKIATYFDHIRP